MPPVDRRRDVYLLKGKSLFVGSVRGVEKLVTTGLHAAVQFLCRRGMDELFPDFQSPTYTCTSQIPAECTPLNVYLMSFWNLECIYSVLEFE